MCNLWHKRIIGVGIGEHGADGKEHCIGIRIYCLVFGTETGVALPFEMVKAGLHWSRRMSKHMLPLELMLGW